LCAHAFDRLAEILRAIQAGRDDGNSRKCHETTIK
jgi:hypothetical protein